MSFNKDAEVKVFKSEEGLGSKKAAEGESDRYTVDDFVKDSDAGLVVEFDGEDKDVDSER